MLSNLKYLSINHPNLSFASYFTVNPLENEIAQYFEDFNEVFENQKLDLYVLGAMTSKIDETTIPSNIHIMLSIREFVNVIKQPTPSYA